MSQTEETTKFSFTIDEIIEKKIKAPLTLHAIPHLMGIPLGSVASMEWTRQPDGFLTEFKLNFIPQPGAYHSSDHVPTFDKVEDTEYQLTQLQMDYDRLFKRAAQLAEMSSSENKEIIVLLDRVANLLEMGAYYADEQNWLYNQIKKSDCDPVLVSKGRKVPKGLDFEAGGRMAREALARDVQIRQAGFQK